ncbi:MAG: LysR family transcriptional regulator [Polyangiaceae bacterium]
MRFVLALSRAGSLARAGRALQVDHTTVGRRIEALEKDLSVRLFTRTTTGYVPTREAELLLPDIRRVEESVLSLERGAHAQHDAVEGLVRVTSGETFGACYLAPRLAAFAKEHPRLTIELVTGGEILDLSRREADIAVRFFRSKHENLVVRRVAELAHGLYATKGYLKGRVVRSPADLEGHTILTSTSGRGVVEAAWVEELTQSARPSFVTNMTVGLLEAARAGAGIAVLPKYMGDREASLRYLPMPGEPRESLWITVHRDMKETRRVRVVLDYLAKCLHDDRGRLLGSRG